MATLPPAEVGMALEDVDTPALIVDLDALETNLDRMAAALAGTGARLRAHAKTHKCAMIGRMQMARGAVGLCAQKVSEAEALIQAGIPNVLVSNEVAGARKLRRLAALARQATVAVCADDAGNVDDLDAAAAEAGVTLDVLVEIDVGAGRCGVAPGEPALALARRIAKAPHLRFGGLQAYHGSAQHIRDYEARRLAVEGAIEKTRATVEMLAADGHDCAVVGGAGTGTYQFESASGIYNEIQAGSYVFMDADYGRNRDADGEFFHGFENSLFIHTTVMSHPTAERAVVDAGLKALSVDAGMPTVLDMADVAFLGASDEHGKLDVTALAGDSNRRLRVGDRIMLVPGHCDPTVNLYDWYVCVRGGRVEALWPVTARGAVY